MMAVLGLRDLPGTFSTDEECLGEVSIACSHPQARLAEHAFKDELASIERRIHERNQNRVYPYDAFNPSNLTCSASW